MFPDLGRRLLALLAALPHIVDVALEVAPVVRLRPHLDLHRRRPGDALRVARVAVAEHHPERVMAFWKQCAKGTKEPVEIMQLICVWANFRFFRFGNPIDIYLLIEINHKG